MSLRLRHMAIRFLLLFTLLFSGMMNYAWAYSFTVIADPSSYGKIQIGTQTAKTSDTYTYTTTSGTIQIKAIPNTHYKFVKWTDNSSTSATRNISTNAGNDGKTYTATFAKETYKITAQPNQSARGTVTGGGTYEYSTSVTLTATPKQCRYSFKQWSDGSTTNPRTITVTETKTYTAVFEENPSGTTGSLTWSLNSCDSTLTLSGTGEMPDYTYSGSTTNQPWVYYKHCIKHVVIGEGVTSIGNYAFYNFPNIISVSNPSTLQRIGNYAFTTCRELETFNFPDGLQQIGTSAFYNCNNLQAIYIPASVTTINADAFLRCWSVTSIVVHPDNPIYDSRDNCNAIIEKSTKTLWYGCQYTVIPDGVWIVKDWAFEYQHNLQSIRISSTVHTFGTISAAGGVFKECENLKDIYVEWTTDIPAWHNLTRWSEHSSDNLDATIRLHVPCGYKALYEGTSGWNKYQIVDDHLTGGICGAQGSNLTWMLSCDGTLTISGTGAMADYTDTDAPWYSHSSDITSVIIGEGITTIGNYAFYQFNSLSSVTVPSTLTSIGSHAFHNCGVLLSITIPDGVATIGEEAFQFCSNLTSITIPNSVTTLGSNVFRFCNNISNIYVSWTENIPAWNNMTNKSPQSDITLHVPCGKTAIYQAASGWKNYTITDDVTLSYSGTCGAEGDNLTWSLNLCDSTLTISGTGAMKDFVADADCPWYPYRSQIYTINIGDGVTTIGSKAFVFSRISSITIPNSVTSIGRYAFCYSNYLEEIVLPEGLISIGDHAFYYGNVLKTVHIPSSVTSLGVSAFEGCSLLQDLYVSWSSSIPEWPSKFSKTYGVTLHVPCEAIELYRDATGWKNYNVAGSDIASGTCGADGDNLTWTLSCDSTLTISGTGAMADWGLASNVPWYAYRNAIKTVVIEEGVTTIGARAFHSCYNLTSITIPSTVTQIGQNVFMGCPVLDNLYISDLEAWCNITMVNGASSPFSHNNTGIPTKVGNLYLNNSLVTTLVIPDGITTIKRYLFSGFCSFTTIQFNQVSSIGEYAFTCNHGIESLDIPSTVTSIDACAFSYCLRLETAILPDGLTTMSHSVLYNCYNLTSVTIPASVTSIEEYALNNCHNLTDMYVGWTSAIPAWPNYFTNKTPQSAIMLHVPCGKDALYQAATGWQDYTIAGIAKIVNGTCGTAGHEDEVTWSLNLCDSVLTISGTGAMADWNFAPWSSNRLAIKTVVINSGVTNIGNNAFANCENLQSVTIPESVTTIGVNAFYRCFKLKSITIPQSVISLGLFALNSCNALTDIYVSWTNSIPNRPMNFTSTSSITLHVPCGKEALYSAAAGWQDYTIEGEGGPYTVYVKTATGDMSMGTVSITEN